jgi:hypothetical protein
VKYFTYRVVVQVTQEVESFSAAEMVAEDFKDRLSDRLDGFQIVGGGSTAIHLFLLSVKDESVERSD